VIFKNFFAESEKIALGKEILCRESASLLLVKKSLARVSFCVESFLFASRQRSLFAVFLLCREFFIWLSAQKQTLGKD
jgi:hypothetical protein